MDMLKLTSPQATGKRALNRIRNRHAILRAARDCFQEHGYDNTTIRDIVRRTGLAAGTFYNYFSSKQDIFAALLSDFLTSLNNDMSQQRQSASSTQEFVYRAYLALYSATAKDPVVYELAHQNQPPIGCDSYSDIEPVYEELPGWSESTVGLTSVDQLPENAKAYIRFLEEQIEAPIDIISTGPDRVETITLRHPFGE